MPTICSSAPSAESNRNRRPMGSFVPNNLWARSSLITATRGDFAVYRESKPRPRIIFVSISGKKRSSTLYENALGVSPDVPLNDQGGCAPSARYLRVVCAVLNGIEEDIDTAVTPPLSRSRPVSFL